MSSPNGTTPVLVPPPPPPGLNYVAAIKPAVNFLMIGTIWSSFLIPVAIALFFFSTPFIRRQPIFILNVLIIVCGLVVGVLNAWLEIESIIGENATISVNAYLGYTVLQSMIPIFVDLILLVRLFAVYPPRRLAWSHIAVIYSPPIVLKIVRVANLSVFFARDAAALQQGAGPAAAGQRLWGEQPWTKIEWVLSLVDNAYMSGLFLYRLRSGAGNKSRVGTLSSSRGSAGSYGSRLRALFWIAVTNFVFPSLFNLVLLIYVFRDKNSLYGSYLYLCNIYIEIIGVLLATVWSSGTQWSANNLSKHETPLRATQSSEIIEFAARPRGGPTLGTATVTVPHDVTQTTDSERPSAGGGDRDSQYEMALHKIDSAKGRDLEEGFSDPYRFVKLEE